MELGFCCVPTQHLVKELVLQMLKRMKHRTEANPYQSVAFHLKTFPLSVAKTIFPEEQLESSTPTSKTWVLDSATKVAMVLGPLMSAHGRTHQITGGASKGLKTASQQWIRVLATVVSAELSWVATSGGTDRLHVNFMYVLSDEMGEITLPKDSNRQEISLGAATLHDDVERCSSVSRLVRPTGVPTESHGSEIIEDELLKAVFVVLRGAGRSASRETGQPQEEGGDFLEIDSIVEAETQTVSRQRGFWV